MQFNMPRSTEKTELELLCDMYGAALNTFEWTLLTRMPANEIEVILLYELKKALLAAQHKVSTYLGKLNMLNKRYRSVECDGNGELCMKLLAESEHVSCMLKQAEKLVEHLKTLG